VTVGRRAALFSAAWPAASARRQRRDGVGEVGQPDRRVRQGPHAGLIARRHEKAALAAAALAPPPAPPSADAEPSSSVLPPLKVCVLVPRTVGVPEKHSSSHQIPGPIQRDAAKGQTALPAAVVSASTSG